MLRRYRPLFLVPSLLILLLLAYAALWSAAAWRMNAALADAPGKAAEKGIVLALQDPVVEGFPLRLTARLSAAQAQWPSGTRVETGPVTLSAWAWAPLEIGLDVRGPLRLDLAGSARHAPVAGMAGGLHGALSLGLNGKPRQVAATLETPRTLATDGLGALAAAAATVTWVAPLKTPEGPTDSQGQIHLLVGALDLPGDLPPPLSPRVEQVALSYEPRGPLPPKPSVDGMTAWRDGGGTLEILSLRLLWSGMDLRANATLALDRDMQPEGAGTAQLSGADVLIEVLKRGGGLTPEQAGNARAALDMLARTTDDGRRILSVPVTLQERRLSVGPIQVATLPVIPWN